MKPSSLKFLLANLFILVVTFISFYPSLSNGWTSWDDNIYVTDNPVVTDISFNNIKTVFTKGTEVTFAPLTVISLMIDYQIGGYDPHVYHTTSLILHLFNASLAFYLCYLLSGNFVAACIAGVLFGIHPMRVESVAWISGRKDVLAMFFFLLSSISYLLFLKKQKPTLLTFSFLFFVLAVLSKVIVITFPLLLFLYDYQQRRPYSFSVVTEKIPFALVSGALAVIGYLAQESIHAIKKSPHVLDNIIVSLYAVIFYLEKLIIPVNLSNLYPYPHTIPVIFYVYAVLFVFICIILWKKRSNEVILFGSLFYFVSLIPVLQFIKFSRMFAADRFTYFAYIGLFYIVGVYSAVLWEKINKRMFVTICMVVMLSLSYLTWQRCGVWKDGKTLWQDMLSKYPDGIDGN